MKNSKLHFLILTGLLLAVPSHGQVVKKRMAASYGINRSDLYMDTQASNAPTGPSKEIQGVKFETSPLCVEGGSCTIPGTAQVAYGMNNFVIKEMSGTFQCNNATFGDPDNGVQKACYIAINTSRRVTPGQYMGARMVPAPDTVISGLNGARKNSIEVSYSVFSQYPDFIPMAKEPGKNKDVLAAQPNYNKQGLLEWKVSSGGPPFSPSLCTELNNNAEESCSPATGEGKVRIRKDVYDTRFAVNDVFNMNTLANAVVLPDDGLKCLVTGRLEDGSICGYSRMNIPSLMRLLNAKDGVLTYTGRWEAVFDESTGAAIPKDSMVKEVRRGVNFNVCRGLEFSNALEVNYTVRRPQFKIKFYYNADLRKVQYKVDQQTYLWADASEIKLPSPIVYATPVPRAADNFIGLNMGYEHYQNAETSPQRDNRRIYSMNLEPDLSARMRNNYEVFRAENDPSEPFTQLGTTLGQGVLMIDPVVRQSAAASPKTVYRVTPGITEFLDPKNSWASRIKEYYNTTGIADQGSSCSLPTICAGPLRNSPGWPKKDLPQYHQPGIFPAKSRVSHFACDEINEPAMKAEEAKEQRYTRLYREGVGSGASPNGAIPRAPVTPCVEMTRVSSGGKDYGYQCSRTGPQEQIPPGGDVMSIIPEWPEMLTGDVPGRPNPQAYVWGTTFGHKDGFRGGFISNGGGWTHTGNPITGRTDIGNTQADVCQASTVWWTHKQSGWKWVVSGFGTYEQAGDDADTPIPKPPGKSKYWAAVVTSMKQCPDHLVGTGYAQLDWTDTVPAVPPDPKTGEGGSPEIPPQPIYGFSGYEKGQCPATWEWQMQQTFVAAQPKLSYRGLEWNACTETCEVDGTTNRICHRPYSPDSGAGSVPTPGTSNPITSSGGGSGSTGGTSGGTTTSSTGTSTGSTVVNTIVQKSGSYVAATSPAMPYDFFAPADYETKDYPVMIFIHGGGWYMGSNADNLEINKHMAQRGYKVIAPTYTLTQQLPNQMNDIAAFSQWLAANKSTFGITSAPISIGGGSAGAHLALFEATQPNRNFKCVFDVAGPVDLTKIQGDMSTVDYMGDTATQASMNQFINDILTRVAPTASQKQQASITGNINAQNVFVLHNEKDFLVPNIQSQRLVTTYGSKIKMLPLPYSAATRDGGHNLGGSIQAYGVPAFDQYVADSCK